jgi:hypothetical protein
MAGIGHSAGAIVDTIESCIKTGLRAQVTVGDVAEGSDK